MVRQYGTIYESLLEHSRTYYSYASKNFLYGKTFYIEWKNTKYSLKNIKVKIHLYKIIFKKLYTII